MSVLSAEQQTLAAEHAAVYVLGVLGGLAATLPAPVLHTSLATAYVVHRTRRDELEQMVRAAGGTPVAGAAAYDVPRSATTVAAINAEALRVERACTTTYAALVAATATTQRGWAIARLRESAVSELGFGGRPQALPGVGTTH